MAVIVHFFFIAIIMQVVFAHVKPGVMENISVNVVDYAGIRCV